MRYTADFETTTDVNDCRVWAWAVCEIGDTENFEYGNTIESFMSWCAKRPTNVTVYFHNLKFDGEYILYWALKNGYIRVKNKKELKAKTFSSLISETGVFYSIEICFDRNENYKNSVVFYDSLKVLPESVENIAETFKLPIKKLELDYREYREPGHELTVHEIDYIRNDVTIMSLAMSELFSQKLDKITIGSNALCDYKKTVTAKKFKKWFPVPHYDEYIRKSYRGGFTYLNPEFREKDIAEGLVLDVNSLYPSVMYYNKLPYGDGIEFKGKYEPDEVYDLYVQCFSCQFELKENKIPTVQLKNNRAFMPTEYLSSSQGEYITMYMTNVDLELFLEHYDVYDINYYGGFKFKSATGLFREYIDKWNNVKVQATIDGNGGLRKIAKLMLNNLYGKFALNPEVRNKIPYLDENGIVRYEVSDPEYREPIYIPVGTFITSWARYKTITSAQTVYNRFIYADTDSLHLVGTDIPEELDISPTELGKWKIESTFTRARFLRQKSYIEEINGKLEVTCAGMPDRCHENVTWDNFKIGNEIPGKLKIAHVKGGIVLVDSPHTLRA